MSGNEVVDTNGDGVMEEGLRFATFVAWANNQLARFSFPIVLQGRVNRALTTDHGILTSNKMDGPLQIQLAGYHSPTNKVGLYADLIRILQVNNDSNIAVFTFDGDELVGPDVIKVLKRFGFQGVFSPGSKKGTFILQINKI